MQFLMDPQQQQHPPPPPPPQPAAQPSPQAPPAQLMFQQPPVLVAPPPPQQQPTLPPPLQQQQQQQQQQVVPAAPAGGGGVSPAPMAAVQPQIQPFTQVPVNPPTPNLVSVPVGNHPPYAQMISEAITALKEKDGSSKRAIAGFIERAYGNSLTTNHSVLLTSHLKRLKDQGLIVMVKHSYKLPDPNHIAAAVRSPPVDPSQPSIPASNGPKRRGRPPKPKAAIPVSSVPPQPGSVDPAPVPVPVHIPPAPPVTNPAPGTDPVSVFASLGLSDGPIHVPVATAADPSPAPRRRGRPRKAEPVGAPPPLQVNATLAKRSPGRPRKVAAKNAVNAAAGGAVAVIPPKVQLPKLKKDGTPMKPRGRPPRKNVPVLNADASVPVPVPVPGATGATIAPAVYVGEGALTVTPAPGPAPGAKRRGRPPTKALKVQNGPKKARKLSGKPLGRPKKFAPQVQGAGVPHAVPYDEMKRKLEFYQMKIKQSVNVLKPCIDSNTNAAGALNALKELEELANGGSAAAVATVPVQQPPVQS
ncbi:OLC1v1014299C1 [Oldenlandia corymbosa var. corymbosa]|uniref:OLC1v1014299C1 n=1 Tax=Oldenlandia corymbosa var. corymbosa TaxID=529605 RepID=A0AAV1E2I7_OLDCO|nr:OLC1v1014299C1 [Oldenlandia corymbosa var. corymbosa]